MTTFAPDTLPVVALSARELGWQDGYDARQLHQDTSTITYPSAVSHGITSVVGRRQYHQGWIRGRLGAPKHDRCGPCHANHPDGAHVTGVMP